MKKGGVREWRRLEGGRRKRIKGLERGEEGGGRKKGWGKRWGEGGWVLHADNEAFCAHFTSKQTLPCI